MNSKKPKQTPTMHRFSTLAGPFSKLPKKGTYRVAFNDTIKYDGLFYRGWTRVMAYGTLLLTIGFGVVLFQPSHWLINQQPDSPVILGNYAMLACLILLQLFVLLGTYSATRSTLKSKEPVPVRPQRGLSIAFATTRAPGEPIAMVEKTLRAAKNVRYVEGTVDVWLLDETGDTQLIDLCMDLGVRYFSRHGISKWNTPKPPSKWSQLITICRQLLIGAIDRTPEGMPNPYLAAKSKHGNFNSWREYLVERGLAYDILAGVDTDQVPEPNYLERLLGYFRDPDVAYVVGPQVYGNYAPGISGLVARWAESQASFFQSTIQRAGNASTSAMFVGTNYAVRLGVIDQIGGFQACITEDMATGLAIHSRRNPVSGNHWKSVYTPDVLAIGEGPDFWAPYFTQQWRWAAGTFDTWRKMFFKVSFKLPPRALLHYLLILSYYPITALTWLLAVTSGLIYLTTGATAVSAPSSQFVSLYLMTVVMQLSLYFWNRRYNVSPHEPEGSYGIPGLVISAVTAPIYLSALIGVTFGKKANFVVTTKGGSDNPDWFAAFKTHLQWASILLVGIGIGIVQNHHHPTMVGWVIALIIICLVPFILGMTPAVMARMKKRSSVTKLSSVGGAQNA